MVALYRRYALWNHTLTYRTQMGLHLSAGDTLKHSSNIINLLIGPSSKPQSLLSQQHLPKLSPHSNPPKFPQHHYTPNPTIITPLFMSKGWIEQPLEIPLGSCLIKGAFGEVAVV